MDYYENQTYYDILGLPKYGKKENGEQISLESIMKAKDKLKFGNPDDRVPFSMWNKIDEAYKVLSNLEERKKYDKKLEQEILTGKFTLSETNIEKASEQKIEEPGVKENFTYGSITPELTYETKETILSIPTSLLTTINIVEKLNERKKYKLIEENSKKTITEVKTRESKLIENYREVLNLKINKILNQYHTNYDLMINKIRYENYIELLKKRIELKENEIVKKGRFIIYKLQLNSLRNQLNAFENCLEKVR